MQSDLLNQWFESQKEMLNTFTRQQDQSEYAKQWQDAYTSYLDQQQNAWKNWQEMVMKPADSQVASMFTNPVNQFQQLAQYQQDNLDRARQLYENNPFTAYMQQLPDFNAYLEQSKQFLQPFSFNNLLNSDSNALFQKMMNANTVFNQLNRVYQSFQERIGEPTLEEFQRVYQEMSEQGLDYYQTFVVPFIPEQVRSYFDAPLQVLGNLQEQSQSFLAPWFETQRELTHLYLESLSGDTGKLTEMYDEWRKTYSETISPYLNSPFFGNDASKYEAYNQLVDQMFKVLLVTSEFNAKIQQVTRDHIEEELKDYALLVEKGEDPKSFKDFYMYWSRSIEKTLNEYFYTDEFADLFAELTTAQAKLKMQRDVVLEKLLSDLPIVLESDARSVYKKLHDVRRQVRRLEKEVEELNAKLDKPKKTTKKAAAKKKTK